MAIIIQPTFLFQDLEKAGLLRGTLTVEEQHQLISGCDNLEKCIPGSKYLQVMLLKGIVSVINILNRLGFIHSAPGMILYKYFTLSVSSGVNNGQYTSYAEGTYCFDVG